MRSAMPSFLLTVLQQDPPPPPPLCPACSRTERLISHTSFVKPHPSDKNGRAQHEKNPLCSPQDVSGIGEIPAD